VDVAEPAEEAPSVAGDAMPVAEVEASGDGEALTGEAALEPPPPDSVEPSVEGEPIEPSVEGEQAPRRRRAVRAVLTPQAPPPAEPPAAGAEPPTASSAEDEVVESDEGEGVAAADEVPVEPAPARRRARAARRATAAPDEPAADERPVPADEPEATTTTPDVPSAESDGQIAEAGAPAVAEGASEEEPAPASTRRRRLLGRRGRSTADAVAAVEESAARLEPEAEAGEEEAPTDQPEPAAPPRATTPKWGATSPFSAGFEAQTAPRVVRRPVTTVTFQAPDLAAPREQTPRERDRDRETTRPPRGEAAAPVEEPRAAAEDAAPENAETVVAVESGAEAGFDDGDLAGTRRRRRGRRGRGRARGEDEGYEAVADGEAAEPVASGAEADEDEDDQEQAAEFAEEDEEDEDGEDRSGSRRRRRRRRRAAGTEYVGSPDDPPNTVVHVREARRDDDLVRGVSGSTRLEAKRQRRREGRDSGRRRPPIVTEAEFLARRESVERRMLVRHAGDRTQIAVLEDGVLVEHFVTRASSASYAGNVYLGRVQNVLASMEAAFVDIGKGRNAVLYAGEVNYDASGLEGKPRKIEQVLKPGQPVLVQVSKDPIGHKGARLTSQISLPGRYLVYVPDGQNAGISRKLPDTERARLKSILKKITPQDGGVIVRTAAEGASEQELERDIERLVAQWEDISRKAQRAGAPSLLYGEPDLVVRVIRDIFNEDFSELVVQGSGEAETIESYIDLVAPDLRARVRRHVGTTDLFTEHRVDEQLAKALDRKVWLPSGGSLVIDRTEAMTVVDVNTGKFTGKGGNLEETVTKNNLEAAEEIVRQLRLRDIGGIIVIDFIDMVLESNRELVLRRLTECLGRDRTRHQVAEVTSLGLVQMTRKRVGQGLLEAYSEPCAHCNGRGVVIHLDGHNHLPPVAPLPVPAPPARRGRRGAAGEPDDGLGVETVAEIVETEGLEPVATDGAAASREREAGGRRRRARRAASPVLSAVPEEMAVLVDPAVGADDERAAAARPTAGDGTGWPDAFGGARPVERPAGTPGGLGWPATNGAVAVAEADLAATVTDKDDEAETGEPTVFANASDPDSIAVGEAGRGRRPRRASRPVAKPGSSVEATASVE
jgi:ribonuclease E